MIIRTECLLWGKFSNDRFWPDNGQLLRGRRPAASAEKRTSAFAELNASFGLS